MNQITRMKNALALALGLLGIVGLPEGLRAQFTTNTWTSDTNSGIAPADLVWAYHFGSTSTAVVNSISIPGIATTNPAVAGRFAVSGIPFTTSDLNNLTALGGTGSAVLAATFNYGGSPGVVRLEGLTPGKRYIASFYSVGWDAPPIQRTSTFSSGTNALAVDQNAVGENNGLRVDYQFVATATTNVITITPTNANTFHLYGLALRAPVPFVTGNPMSAARYAATATLLPDGRLLVAGGFPLTTSVEIYDPATGQWTNTAPMAAARWLACAVLLPNGKVLVAGGQGAGFLASAELYDPATGTWTNTASMGAARSSSPMVVLPDGNVLIAGGLGTNGALSSAEVYHPASGTWTSTGSMNTNRYVHALTLLTNGKVLVAGGNNGPAKLASAQLYDPATGVWTNTGSLLTARSSFSATLLPDGRVLAAGGYGNSGELNSAETFNPATGTWSEVAPLTQRRYLHAASLLPDGRVLVAGGQEVISYFASAEIFDPATGGWSTSAPLNTGRAGFTATLLPQGRVLFIGGYGGTPSGYLASTEWFDPAAGYWTNTTSLTASRTRHTATLLPNGKVLVAGGAGLASAELYDPATGLSTTTASMSVARSGPTATLLRNGKVLVAGGESGGSSVASAELYDPATGLWTTTAPMNGARAGHSAKLLPDGRVLVAGGFGSGHLTSAELYDPGTGLWTNTSSMSGPRSSPAATLLPNGKVLVAGGYSGFSPINTAELYDAVTGLWTNAPSMSGARNRHTMTLLPNGRVLAAGGEGSPNTSELYDPVTGSWSGTSAMIGSHFLHTATLLPNGKVLVAGGFGPAATAELYDPATGLWTNAPSMSGARSSYTATLLPNGRVLVAGGNGSPTTSELYDFGLRVPVTVPSVIQTNTSTLGAGTPLVLGGTRFRGVSGASSGGYQNSSTDYPLVQLRSLDNEQVRFLPTTNWSSNAVATIAVTNFPPGWCYATVFVNGIPSGAKLLLHAPLTVQNTNDAGPGSLRLTVQNAPTGSSIDFATNLGGATITLASSIDPTVNLTVDGGARTNGIILSGGGVTRHFFLNPGLSLVLKRLTLTRGLGIGGGAIANLGNLTVSQCTLSSNLVNNLSTGGGAIENNGFLTLTRSTLFGNAAPFGGAMVNDPAGTAYVTHCTFTTNASTGTSAGTYGGGAIDNYTGTLILYGNLFSDNTAVTGDGPNLWNEAGSALVATNNLLTVGTSSTLINGVSGNQVGSLGVPLNARLSAPGRYGGPTVTIALLPLSPARNAATGSTSAPDQRGLPLVGTADIGAYEAGTPLDFATWCLETNGSLLAFGSDTDNDTAAAGLEYALRRNPGARDNTLIPALVSTNSGRTFTFRYRPAATDLRYLVQRSSNLATWTEIYRNDTTTGLITKTGITSTENAGTEVTTLTDPAIGPRLFWRLKVEKP